MKSAEIFLGFPFYIITDTISITGQAEKQMIPTHHEQVSSKLKSKFSTRIRWPRLKSEHKHPTRPPKVLYAYNTYTF